MPTGIVPKLKFHTGCFLGEPDIEVDKGLDKSFAFDTAPEPALPLDRGPVKDSQTQRADCKTKFEFDTAEYFDFEGQAQSEPHCL